MRCFLLFLILSKSVCPLISSKMLISCLLDFILFSLHNDVSLLSDTLATFSWFSFYYWLRTNSNANSSMAKKALRPGM